MNEPLHTNEKQLKDAVLEISEKPRLSEDMLNQLLDKQDDVLGSEFNVDDKPHTGLHRVVQDLGRSPLAKVASVLVFVSMFMLFQWYQSPEHLTQQIANEVVKNHLKLKPLDVETHSMRGIQTYFTQLDFMPSASSVLQQQYALTEDRLIGGRYCTIKGVTAAQLRFTTSNPVTPDTNNSAISTLYQVPYDADLHGEMPDTTNGELPKQLMVKGMSVSLWKEKGLLFALVTQE